MIQAGPGRQNGSMTTQDDSYPSQWFGRPGAAADDWQAGDEAMRQELAGYSRDDLKLLADLQFMFSADCPPETRARSTTRRRVAQAMLDEMARLDFPADGHAFGGPSTCINHVKGEVHFAAQDDDGLLGRLSNWIVSRLRNLCC